MAFPAARQTAGQWWRASTVSIMRCNTWPKQSSPKTDRNTVSRSLKLSLRLLWEGHLFSLFQHIRLSACKDVMSCNMLEMASWFLIFGIDAHCEQYAQLSELECMMDLSVWTVMLVRGLAQHNIRVVLAKQFLSSIVKTLYSLTIWVVRELTLTVFLENWQSFWKKDVPCWKCSVQPVLPVCQQTQINGSSWQ